MLSIIIPAKNEAISLDRILPGLRSGYRDAEIIVVNDGSDDETEAVCKQHHIRVISHPYSMGNGAAVKTGARHASGDILVFMDADGQHQPKDISKLLKRLDQGYDMVVGARNKSGQANAWRSLANRCYNKLASWMVNQKVEDLTSGFRAVRAEKFREFLHLFPNGFSYPTTVTMSFFRAGYAVAYEPIEVLKREGNSHINAWRDGLRFVLIIFKVGTLYSPFKLFFPIAMAHFGVGVAYYLFTFFTEGRFTNMSALLLTTSVIVFLIGLISEQITMLLYQEKKHR